MNAKEGKRRLPYFDEKNLFKATSFRKHKDCFFCIEKVEGGTGYIIVPTLQEKNFSNELDFTIDFYFDDELKNLHMDFQNHYYNKLDHEPKNLNLQKY